MGVRRWFVAALGGAGEQADAEALVEAACVPLAQGPILVAALEAEGIEVASFESFDVVTDTRSSMRIMVRRRDLEASNRILEATSDLSGEDPGGDGDGPGAVRPTDHLAGGDVALATGGSTGDEEGPADEEGVDQDGDPELLGELFVAADRLLHTPGSEELIAEMERHRSAMTAAPPFGIERATWSEAMALASAVVEAGRNGAEEAVADQARALRSLLRDLV